MPRDLSDGLIGDLSRGAEVIEVEVADGHAAGALSRSFKCPYFPVSKALGLLGAPGS